jgi:hypothetical protein
VLGAAVSRRAPASSAACGQGPSRNVQEATLETLPQRASRDPLGVAMHSVWPSVATTPRARHLQSAFAGGHAAISSPNAIAGTIGLIGSI